MSERRLAVLQGHLGGGGPAAPPALAQQPTSGSEEGPAFSVQLPEDLRRDRRFIVRR